MEKMVYKMADSYPEVTACCPNPRDVALLRPLYAGACGELTAILQYSYQHVVLEKCNDDISEILMQIAIVEMHHLELLAEAICALGGDPKYYNPESNNWWNAGAVNYEQCLCKALLCNLKGETDTHRAYMETACKVKTPCLAALLRRIAADEKCHMEIFTHLINCHCRNH